MRAPSAAGSPTWRWALVWVTQLLFYGLPWLQWNGRQAVLFDLGARRFYIFGLVLYPQDFIYLTGLLIISAYGLFLFTAVAGRLWCGYACPQTVYTEIFMWVEHHIEGDRTARMKLDAAPWNGEKLLRKGGKQVVWIAIGLWTGFTFVGYFTPIRTLAAEAADAGLRPVGVVLGPVLRLRHLRQRRLHARAGVQVHVPVRALPERDVRPRHADHQLRRRARRAARLAPAQGRQASLASSARATASTARCACRSARPASTSARACSTNASAAPPASTCATA